MALAVAVLLVVVLMAE